MLIDSRLLTIRLRSEEDECRFYIYNEARHSVPGLYLLDKSRFSCVNISLFIDITTQIIINVYQFGTLFEK